MLASEFGDFEALMRQFEKIFGKKIDDETMQVYWRALKDLPFGLVRAKAEIYLKRAKFFPKPAELRPKDSAVVAEPDERSRRDFDKATERNISFWDEEFRIDPVGTKWKLLDAYVARISVTEHPSTVFYEEKMAFARDACRRLLAITGLQYVAGNTHLQHTVSRLMGASMFKQAVDLDYDRQHKTISA